MKQDLQKHSKLKLLIFIVFVLLVFLQSLWLTNATLLQQKEQELQLKQVVDEVALVVNSLGHKYFHNGSDSSSFKDLEIKIIEEKIDSVLIENGINEKINFGIYKESEPNFFIINNEKYQTEILESNVKSCLSCIVSFSVVNQENSERLPNENDTDYSKRIIENSDFQYFSPVQRLSKKDKIWLVLYQPFAFSTAIQSMMSLFIINLILLIILLYLFNYLIKLLSNYKKITQLKEDFFSNMTHEFKTPLSSILLASRMLRKNNSAEKAMIYYDLIEKESKTLENQIDKLLELSLLDKEEIELDKKTVNIDELLAKIPNRMKLLLDNQQSEIQLNLNLKNPILELDEYHFTNSICNLVENSLKYSDGRITIGITSFTKNKFNFISIKDNGKGIEKEFQPFIFDRFYRAKKTNEYKTKGFGIGLSYVKSIIEAHNGTIQINSNYQNGCEFIIKI